MSAYGDWIAIINAYLNNGGGGNLPPPTGGGGGSGINTTFSRPSHTFIATANQAIFDITGIGTYEINKGYLGVWIARVKQYGNFTETSPTSFTLDAGVPLGTEVYIELFQGVGANLTGTTGPMGPAGPQGIQGLKGGTGPQGIIGVAGPVGPVGPFGPAGAIGPGIVGVNDFLEVGELNWNAAGVTFSLTYAYPNKPIACVGVQGTPTDFATASYSLIIEHIQETFGGTLYYSKIKVTPVGPTIPTPSGAKITLQAACVGKVLKV